MIGKYYSLDECSNQDEVFSYLENLQDDGKIYFEVIDLDVIKFKDVNGLTAKEIKEFAKYLYENDVIEYPDYRKDGYYDDEFDSFDDEDDEFNSFNDDEDDF